MKKCVMLFLTLLLLGVLALDLGEGAVFFYEDQGTGVTDMITYQDQLYILKYEGLFRYDAVTRKEVLVNDQISGYWGNEEALDRLLTDGQWLYGFNTQTLALVKILDGAGTPMAEKVFEASLLKEKQVNQLFLENGELIALTEGGQSFSSGQREQELVKINMLTGAVQEIPVYNITSLHPYKKGDYLAFVQKMGQEKAESQLALINGSTGAEEVLGIIDPTLRLEALCYDEKNDMIYGADRSRVLRWDEKEGFLPAANTIAGDTMAITAFGNNMVGLVIDNSVAILSVDPARLLNQKRVVVQDPVGRGENYKGFITNHPDIELAFTQQDSVTPEERFVQDMLTKAQEIDVYILSDKNMLTTIKNKEYGVDLAQSPVIKALTDDMYPPFYKAFSEGEKVFAFPRTSFITLLTYNPAVFEELGFDLPQTYDELFDLCRLWVTQYALDYPHINLNPFVNGVELSRMLERYSDEKMKNGQPINFLDPQLQKTIQNYLDVKALYHQANVGRGDISALYLYDALVNSGYTYLPLAFDRENKAVISGSDIDLTYFVVNPYSKNIEEALLFVESFEENRQNMEKGVLYQGEDQPKEDKDFAAETARKEEGIKELEEALSTALPQDRQQLEERIEIEKTALDTFKEKSRWSVAPGEIEKYRQLVEQIYIAPINPVGTLVEDYSQLFIDVEAGNMTVETFLKEIGTRSQIILMEGE